MTTDNPSIVTISYNDLVKFSREDSKDGKRLMDDIATAYGANGLGILSVTDVPGLPELRQRLLPQAAQIPALPEEDLSRCVVEEACYAVGWSHGKEELTPGVPDLSKGSFYANPLVNDLSKAMLERRRDGEEQKRTTEKDKEYEADLKRLVEDNPSFFAPNVFPESLPDLEAAMKGTGQLVADVGRLVARVCQAYCEEQGVMVDLERILCESLNCKARLLHYFDTSKVIAAGAAGSDRPTNISDEKKDELQQQGDLWWCGWHNDHGSLTGLVPAIYFSDNGETQLTSSPDPKAGLYIQSRSGDLVKASLPSNCLGFQIGETFQILSGGLLQATPHAVKQTSTPGVTRETYAVFLEPEYDFLMSIPAGRTLEDCCPPNKANEELKLNSIKSRWKPGMHFGDFNNVTLQTFHHDNSES